MKKRFDIDKLKKEFGLDHELKPYEYEKYKEIYKAYFKELTVEQYKFCRQNGSEWRIEQGYDLIVPRGPWEEQPNTKGIATKKPK